MLATKLLSLLVCISQIGFAQGISHAADSQNFVSGVGYKTEKKASTSSIDGESLLYGFTIDNSIFNIKWSKRTVNVSYNSVYCGTLVMYTGGVKMINKLSSGKYAYGVLMYAVMSPQEFKIGSSTYRGRSRYLAISSSTTSTQSLISTQPSNVSGSSSYSIGVSLQAGTSGVSGSISATTSITKNALDVTNSSNTSTGKVNIKYQYNRHLWPWDWTRTKYCWYESYQRASFFFSSSSTVYSKSITIKPTFAIDSGTIGMWNMEMGYEITASTSVSVSFPN